MNFEHNPTRSADGQFENLGELEKVALDNLQSMLYQADLELIKNWMPILCSAMKTGKLGETVILGYGQYAVGDHDSLRTTLRLLEAEFPDEYRRELINFESQLLRMRYEFNYGNFDAVEKMYMVLPEIEQNTFNRNNAAHFSKHRCCLVSAFYLQDKEKFDFHYKHIEAALGSEYGTVAHLTANSFKAMNEFLNGNYLIANEYALAALKVADEIKANGAYLPFEAAFVLADTYLEFGEDKKSQEIIDKYLALAIEFNQYPWITAFYARDSFGKLQAGNISGALASLRKGREAVDGPLFNELLSFPLDFHELFIRVPMGEYERVSEILYRLPDIELVKHFKYMIEFMKNPSSGPAILNNFPEKTEQDLFRREAFMAMLNVNNRPEAIRHLRAAIDYAMPNGYFRSFLNMPPEIKSYILDLATASPTVYLEKLSKAIRSQSSNASSSINESHTPLTKRELDVLRRLGTQEPITKIAASLHISNNTIKTHLKNMYRKLNVESRDEAVTKGKELSLL